MAYQALYRKWRPADFDDVKGQDHIVTTLKNQLRTGRIGHAYLFCGTRGTGKTTVAKIFAKAVNCEHPTENGPCNECDMCRAVNEQRSMNVREIDAASNNGVDNIREIRDEVAFSPAEGRYKVYIIDEVHMLSAGAYNALLKTLEEPPSYVIFILATTEPHKIPQTILSRCQRYDFHRIKSEVISARLRELADAENIDVEQEALEYISRVADGSMRDALSLLDQCVSFYIGRKLTYDGVLDVLGAVDNAVFGEIFKAVVQGDAGSALSILDEAVSGGRDVMQFALDMTMYFRNLMMISCGDPALASAWVSHSEMEELTAQASMTDVPTIMRYIRIMSELAGSMRYSSQKRIDLEMTIVKLCRPAMESDIDSLVQRVDMLERQNEALSRAIAEGRIIGNRDSGRPDSNNSPGMEKGSAKVNGAAKKKLPEAADEDVARVISGWPDIVKQMPNAVRISLGDAQPAPGDGSQLILMFNRSVNYGLCGEEENLGKITDAVCEYAGAQIEVRLKLVSDQSGKDEFNPLSVINTDGIEVTYEE